MPVSRDGALNSLTGEASCWVIPKDHVISNLPVTGGNYSMDVFILSMANNHHISQLGNARYSFAVLSDPSSDCPLEQ
jgi:hypothetical protein